MSHTEPSPFISGKALNVTIVGGSLAGLMTGVILVRAGHDVRILERNPTGLLHDQGAGVVCGGDLLAFFQQHDRTKTPLAVKSPLRHYLDREGNEIHIEHHAQQMTSWDLLYNVLRANFDGNTGSAPCTSPPKAPTDGQASYEYGSTVTNIARCPNDRVSITYTTASGTQHLEADILIAADGPSSTIRSLPALALSPAPERTYAGYVAWRGTVPEAHLSPAATTALVEKFTFYHAPHLQMLVYVIPGPRGALERGKRLVNWVWYVNYERYGAALRAVLTDTKGHVHRTTLPPGGVQPHVWAGVQDEAEKRLPPQFAEIVRGTAAPFVQTITDVLSPTNVFWDGRVLLVGDAVAGFRPHTAASANQAALGALGLAAVLKGKSEGGISLEEWQNMTMEYARETLRSGVRMGDRSQFGVHPLSA